ncbi:transient receptor potential cation channel subfamily M member 5-like isoform X2 [Dermacentor albipictus]|uniref:transient receptor potential cation channel subfamily M member 5-like isoform X2 n=1 Tax=Dermacentor albipictus TaxID=60249 RepID=UPI0031FCA841
MAAKSDSSSTAHNPKSSVAEHTLQSATVDEPASRYLCGKGTIHFWKNFMFEPEGRPYIRVTHDISIEEVLTIFTREWKFTLPRIVLVVISSLATWQEWSAPRQLENLKEGLIKAANTTAMWILTNGINTGIAKDIGSWVNEELVQRLIMRCHRHPHTDFEKLPPLCLLGIVREDLLTCADKFEASKEGSIYIENTGSRPEENRFDLNPDHTHFIIVKDDTVNKTGLNYFMLKLEQQLSMTPEEDGAVMPQSMSTGGPPPPHPSTLYSAEIPLIALVCQGGTGCNKMVLEHLKKQLPVLVIQGSGGVADLLALAYNEIDRRGATLWDPEFIETVLKPEISSRICQMFPKFRDNALSRNVFKDRIIECLRLACQTQEQMYFTVINIHHHNNNLKHLDDILLKAVFKSQVRHHHAHQMKKDLLLTLDWNCPHVAMTKVFSKDLAQQYQIDREEFEYALLRPKREEFLHIFLNRGFQVNKYLSPKRLRQLFSKIQHEEFFRSVCWEGALGHSMLSKIGKNFIEGDLNWLIETTTGMRDFIDPDELSMNTALGMYIQDAASAERKALVILCLWAVFTNRRKTAEVLWKNCDQPIHLALLISMTYEKLTMYVNEGTIKHELLDTSRCFAGMATGVLNLCYLDSTCRAYDILSVQSLDWKYKTAVDIAAEAKNRKFLSHPCCQKWLTNQFLGRISVRDITWGFFSVPLWLKVILCAFTILPMYIWVRFKSDPHQMDYGDDEEGDKDYSSKNVTENVKCDRYDTGGTMAQEGIFIHQNPPIYRMIYVMWNAPITKFWVYQIFYILFLGTMSIAVLWPSCGDQTLDTISVVWIFLIAVETIDRTYRLHLTNANVPLLSKCIEVFLITFFGVTYLCSRLLRIGLFEDPYNGKVLICVGLLYFYYRQTLIYLPISPQVGPLLYIVKLMVCRDFANFMRMALLVIICGGIVVHAVLYPDYPITVELFRRIFHKAWFSLWLTPITDLEGDSKCFQAPPPDHTKGCFVSRYSDESCPNTGLWPYVFAVLYFVHLKLILLTVLVALFFNTAAEVTPEADVIWKFQRYELVMDFAMRRCLPPPLNAVAYVWCIFSPFLNMCRRALRRKKHHLPLHPLPKDVSKGQKLSERDYHYWRQKALEYSNNLDSANENTSQKMSDNLTLMLEDVDYQRTVLDQLRGQVEEVQRKMSLSLIYLETLKQACSNKGDPMSMGTSMQQQTTLHYISRQSPYPGTKIQRFPVPDKFVPWEVMWLDYDPVAYTRPRTQFPTPLQVYVDEDILMITTNENAQSLPSLKWNCLSTSAGGVSIDRRSWIEDADGTNIIYILENEGVPRYQKSRSALSQGRGMEIALMRIFRTDQFVLPGDFVPGEQKYDGVMRVCFKIPEGTPMSTAEHVKTFFSECLQEQPDTSDPNQAVDCSIARRGYMDDPMNTDNCWREVELWKVHYGGKETLGEKFQPNVVWRLVTDDLFLKLPSGHSNLFNEVWNFQGTLTM